MKYYIATSFYNKEAHIQCRSFFDDAGHELTFDWTLYPLISDPHVMNRAAIQEIDAIEASDFIVVLLPGGRGTHAEIGAALAFDKLVFLVAPHPQQLVDSQGLSCPFYYHPKIHIVSRIENILQRIEEVA